MSESCTDGVQTAMLINSEGSLIASASSLTTKKSPVAGIAASVWNVYLKSGQKDFNSGDLKCVVIECENGVVAIVPVSKLILCLFGAMDCDMGFLKIKAESLAKYLEGPLEKVMSAS